MAVAEEKGDGSNRKKIERILDWDNVNEKYNVSKLNKYGTESSVSFSCHYSTPFSSATSHVPAR